MKTPEATRRFVAMLGREAERLSALVSDLLDLSRLENDAGPMEALRLDRLVVRVARAFRGLAIVRHVAETHLGDVALASTVGAGSAFTVRLTMMHADQA